MIFPAVRRLLFRSGRNGRHIGTHDNPCRFHFSFITVPGYVSFIHGSLHIPASGVAPFHHPRFGVLRPNVPTGQQGIDQTFQRSNIPAFLCGNGATFQRSNMGMLRCSNVAALPGLSFYRQATPPAFRSFVSFDSAANIGAFSKKTKRFPLPETSLNRMKQIGTLRLFFYRKKHLILQPFSELHFFRLYDTASRAVPFPADSTFFYFPIRYLRIYHHRMIARLYFESLKMKPLAVAGMILLRSRKI